MGRTDKSKTTKEILMTETNNKVEVNQKAKDVKHIKSQNCKKGRPLTEVVKSSTKNAIMYYK